MDDKGVSEKGQMSEKEKGVGISKIIPFPKDNPLGYSVVYEGKTYKNSVIYKGKLYYNTNEYIFNENNLKESAKHFLKKDLTYYEIIDKKQNNINEKYNKKKQNLDEEYNKKKQRNRNNFTERENELLEQYYEEYQQLNEKLLNLRDQKADQKDIDEVLEDIEIINRHINELYFTNEYLEHGNSINQKYTENGIAINQTYAENSSRRMNGDFDEIREAIILKTKNLLGQLMRWRESRLLPLFKNSLNLLVNKHRHEDENNMVLKLYNVFYNVYETQLNDIDKRKPGVQEKINRELRQINIKNISPLNPDDFITIDKCSFHHKFVNEKLTDYYRKVYLEKSNGIQCNSEYIQNRNNEYKKQLIYEYLVQQAKGMTAPLPVEPKPYMTPPQPNFEESEMIPENAPHMEQIEPQMEPELENKILNVKMPVNIFNKSIIREKIKVPFKNIGKNMEVYFVKYAKDKIEGRCRNEGYIRKNSCRVITYTSGIVNGTDAIYNVVYLCEVCVPYHNMEVECYIKNITKLGIRAVLSDVDNPMVIYISKEHHKFDLDSIPFQEDEKLTVSICGYHFEKNDEYISSFGILNEMNIPRNPI